MGARPFPKVGVDTQCILRAGGLGVNCRLEPFQKFISFGTLTRPLDLYDYQCPAGRVFHYRVGSGRVGYWTKYRVAGRVRVG